VLSGVSAFRRGGADTAAIEGTSAGDATYTATVSKLTQLDHQRDHVAQQMKDELDAASFSGRNIPDRQDLTRSCESLIAQANTLAGGVSDGGGTEWNAGG
jgi:hypothetical protein